MYNLFLVTKTIRQSGGQRQTKHKLFSPKNETKQDQAPVSVVI